MRWLTTMMALLLGPGLLPGAAAAAEEMTPKRCDGELETCRDGCSVELGSRFEDREKLSTCLAHCDERHELCLLRIVARRKIEERPQVKQTDDADAGTPAGPSAPYSLPPTRYGGAVGRPETSAEEAAPVQRSGVTRAAELPDHAARPPPDSVEPAPDEPPPAPKAKPAPKARKKAKKKKPAPPPDDAP